MLDYTDSTMVLTKRHCTVKCCR
uniref:Uncharacterized protein n=1 Tax=Rhizophora mucronata TaxID=61149 RepID=A0A2P2QDY2_RHIMU